MLPPLTVASGVGEQFYSIKQLDSRFTARVPNVPGLGKKNLVETWLSKAKHGLWHDPTIIQAALPSTGLPRSSSGPRFGGTPAQASF